jgi:hypothetical protein
MIFNKVKIKNLLISFLMLSPTIYECQEKNMIVNELIK